MDCWMLVQEPADAIEINKVDRKKVGKSRANLPSNQKNDGERDDQADYKESPAEYVHLFETRGRTEN